MCQPNIINNNNNNNNKSFICLQSIKIAYTFYYTEVHGHCYNILGQDHQSDMANTLGLLYYCSEDYIYVAGEAIGGLKCKYDVGRGSGLAFKQLLPWVSTI